MPRMVPSIQVALIPPISLIRTAQLTNYQLMLPQLVTDPKYHIYYKSFCAAKRNFVILDNGAAESAKLQWDTLVDIAIRFEPDEVAIPDTLGDSQQTIDRAGEFLQRYCEMFEHENMPALGIVAQGRNAQEATKTVETVMNSPYAHLIKTVYVPRLLISTSGNLFERITVAQNVYDSYGHRLSIHLFGMNPIYPIELKQVVEEVPFVRGVDTSLPYSYTFKGLRLKDEEDNPNLLKPIHNVMRPSNYFSLKQNRFDHKLLEANIRTFISWARRTS